MTERHRPASPQEELAASLIASARLDEEPVPEAARHGMLAALGAAGVVGSASAVAGAASGALHRLALVKWLAATVIVGSAGVGVYAAAVNQRPSSGSNADPTSGGAHAVGQGEKPPVTLAPATVDEASAAPVPPVAEAHDDEASPAEPRAQQHRGAALGSTSADKVNASDSSLEGEVTALDRARSALATGDATRALELLGQYEQAFPKGALRPEATYLRIQALSKSGQRDAARELAARFLAKHPSSPHAAQLQALLSR